MSTDIFSQLGVSTHVATHLRAAAAAAREGNEGSAMTHAWLLTGAPGSGRSIAARAFAAALECDGEVVGCGHCEPCRKVMAGAHTDVLMIVPRELSIKVDFVRENIVVPAAKLPTVGRWRVVVMDNADRLTDEAANSLLKTLEEPPPQTVIILCAPSTDPKDVIPTLVSRMRHLYVPQPSVAAITAALVKEGTITEHDARLAAAASGNHIGRARHLALNKESQQRRYAILNLAELIFHGSEAFLAVGKLVKQAEQEAISSLAAEEEQEMDKLRNALGMGSTGRGSAKALRGSATHIKELEDQHKARRTRTTRDMLDMQLVDLMGLYRDAMMVATGASVPTIHPDMAGLAGELSRLGLPALIGCIDAINQGREHIRANVRPETALDAMVGRIRLACSVS